MSRRYVSIKKTVSLYKSTAFSSELVSSHSICHVNSDILAKSGTYVSASDTLIVFRHFIGRDIQSQLAEATVRANINTMLKENCESLRTYMKADWTCTIFQQSIYQQWQSSCWRIKPRPIIHLP